MMIEFLTELSVGDKDGQRRAREEEVQRHGVGLDSHCEYMV